MKFSGKFRTVSEFGMFCSDGATDIEILGRRVRAMSARKVCRLKAPNPAPDPVRRRVEMLKVKLGVKCMLCNKMFFDKSNFNRHHSSHHKTEALKFENNVAYIEVDGVMQEQCEWNATPLPAATFNAAAAAPGCLERQTKILSKAASLFSEDKWLGIANPSLEAKDASEKLMDDIDEFALVASTAVRSQVMRSKSNTLKSVPFQPLKDLSGISYAATLARFYMFAQIFYNDIAQSLMQLVHKASTEKCNAAFAGCFESFILCLAHVAPGHGNADSLQHAAMHMRRVIRGCAMLFLQNNVEVDIGGFCDDYLNMTKACPFGVLSVLYYEIKRCVPHDKKLLIHRCEPDDGYAEGSAVLVDTGNIIRLSCIVFLIDNSQSVVRQKTR